VNQHRQQSWLTIALSAAVMLMILSVCIAGIVWAWRFILG